jgi:2-methylcitrate dehydratase PrpD
MTAPAHGLTQRVAEFVAGLATRDISSSCLEAARVGFTDCVGVMIAGSAEESVEIVSTITAQGSPGDSAPVIPSGRVLKTADAALQNGVAAHVLDYDDVAMAAHPSAVLVPAILAEGHASNISGSDALCAYVAGYETWAQLDALLPSQLHVRGFHPTAILGAVGAAAACARIRRLGVAQSGHAIGIATSLAAGLVANFGTMTKSLHCGRAAQSGVLAARLAAKGFTAAADVLEHQTGFLGAYSGEQAHGPDREHGRDRPADADRTADLGHNWRLDSRGIDVKRYPTCYATHRCIDAMIALANNHNLHPTDVKYIDVRTGTAQLLLLRNTAPQNALEAKFSMQFAMAAALVARRVGLLELTDAFVARSDVQDVVSKVRCTTTDEKMPGDELFAPDDRVSVELTSGVRLEHPPLAYARGSWQQPLSQAEARDKFMDCAQRGLPASQAADLFDQLVRLSQVPSVRELLLVSSKAPR